MIRYFHCCKPCVAPERHIGCHATCEKYMKAKQKRDHDIECEKQENKGGYDAWNMRRVSIEKTKRHAHDRKERS